MRCIHCGCVQPVKFYDALDVVLNHKGAIYNGLSLHQIDVLIRKIQMAGIHRPFTDKAIEKIVIREGV